MARGKRVGFWPVALAKGPQARWPHIPPEGLAAGASESSPLHQKPSAGKCSEARIPRRAPKPKPGRLNRGPAGVLVQGDAPPGPPPGDARGGASRHPPQGSSPRGLFKRPLQESSPKILPKSSPSSRLSPKPLSARNALSAAGILPLPGGDPCASFPFLALLLLPWPLAAGPVSHRGRGPFHALLKTASFRALEGRAAQGAQPMLK